MCIRQRLSFVMRPFHYIILYIYYSPASKRIHRLVLEKYGSCFSGFSTSEDGMLCQRFRWEMETQKILEEKRKSLSSGPRCFAFKYIKNVSSIGIKKKKIRIHVSTLNPSQNCTEMFYFVKVLSKNILGM